MNYNSYSPYVLGNHKIGASGEGRPIFLEIIFWTNMPITYEQRFSTTDSMRREDSFN